MEHSVILRIKHFVKNALINNNIQNKRTNIQMKDAKILLYVLQEKIQCLS